MKNQQQDVSPPVAQASAALRRLTVAACAAVGLSSAPMLADAAVRNIVTNGGFESPAVNGQQQTFYASAPQPAIPGWTIERNSIDVISKFWTSSEGKQSIDLDGDAPGRIVQSLTTTPGKTYNLTFKYSSHPSLGSTPASMTVTFGDQQQQFVYTGPSTKSNMNWATPATPMKFKATGGATTLRFSSDSGVNSNYGIALDDVQVWTRDQDPLVVSVTPTSVAQGSTGALSIVSGGNGSGAVSFSASGGCTVNGYVVSVTDGTVTCTVVATKAGDADYDPTSTSFVVPTYVPVVYGTPVLFGALATSSGADVYGRIDGITSPTTFQLQAYYAGSCASGALPAGKTPAPLVGVTTADGYFKASIPNVTGFVTIGLTQPNATPQSTCLYASHLNDAWPRAWRVTGASADDYVDAPGLSRWFKFTVLPGQRITVRLSPSSGLPALPGDYDIAVFKDIMAAFQEDLRALQSTSVNLTKLSAEYAPSVFSPSVFSPSVFSPSVFSPDAYSPSVFSPSVFSPSVFSPSVFSPSVFSPSVFSPSVFSPSVFSPSVFSPSVFSPSVFSATELAQAFSSAQTRSIIGVSATPGTGDEIVIVNTWNNVGDFYVRVAGRSGAYSTAAPFTVSVAKEGNNCSAINTLPVSVPAATAGGYGTVILTDSTNVELGTLYNGQTLAKWMESLAADARTNGIIVDIGAASSAGPRWAQLNADVYNRLRALKQQAVNNPTCPYAVNLLAEQIKAVVDSYRASSALKYVVIAGNDATIPFFRYPDQSLLGQESGYVPPVNDNTISQGSLRNDFVLSQDAYGSGLQVSVRTSDYPVPGLAVGRLIEKPEEIAGLVKAYLDQRVVQPSTSLVTGYDFLADAANAVTTELQKGTNNTPDTLITPNGLSPEADDTRVWTATDLGKALLGKPHDLVFLAGHFSANSALAADFKTSLLTLDLDASTTTFTNSIIFSAGCHSGYNIVDGDAVPLLTLPLDWAQAFAKKQATLIAGTGYQYGDTDFLEYSERLYLNFAQQLRTGTWGTPVAVGEALVKAKLAYLAATPDIRGIHEKALLEATLFGLPMLGVDMPGRDPAPAGSTTVALSFQPATTTNAQFNSLGLVKAEFTITPQLTQRTQELTNVESDLNGFTTNPLVATWYTGRNGVVTNPAEPALPVESYNFNSPGPGYVLRGVGFIGGSFNDVGTDADGVAFRPLTGAPTNELRGVHVPFVSPVFYPMRTWSVNYFGALGGAGTTNLIVTPAQHRAKDIAIGTSTLRLYQNMNLRMYYSAKVDQGAFSDAPTIVSVKAMPSGGGAEFAVQVVGDPNVAVYETWVTYTSDGSSQWQSLPLRQCVAPLPAGCTAEDSSLWKATMASVPPNLRFVAQAVNGYGLVTLDDNLGVYYTVGGAGQAGTRTTVVSAPASAKFGDIVTIKGRLESTADGAALAGKNVIVAIGGAARVGTTGTPDASGANFSIAVPMVSLPGTYRVIASFGGDTTYLASSASGTSMTVGKGVTSITALGTIVGGFELSGTIGTKKQLLIQESIRIDVTGAGGSKSFYVITDYLGRAYLPSTGLPAGVYTFSATFAGNSSYEGASISNQPLTIALQGVKFNGGPLPTELPLGDYLFTVKSDSGVPVSVVLAPDPSNVCTLTYDPVTGKGTLTSSVAGPCKISVSANGTWTYTAVSFTGTILYKSGQTITFGALGDKTFGDPDFTVSATVSSPLAVTFSSKTTGVCTVAGSTVHIVKAGTCTIAADQAGNQQYLPAATVTQSFTVKQAAQTVTFLAVGPVTYVAGGSFPVSATASSGEVVTFKSTTTGVCLEGGSNGSVIAMVTPGSCVITASQAGTDNYLPASVQQTVTINKAPQTITFNGMQDRPLSATTFTVTATASSGLPVSFASATLPVCTVSGNVVAMVAVGVCTVTASQGGDTYFAAAPDVSRSFVVQLPNVWTQTATTMTMPRSYHTATRLPDGRVLITGGFDQYGAPTASTELYDPATRKFASAGNMPSKSAAHAAALLANGKVIALGGGNSSAQIFDPATNTWAPAGSLSSNRSYHTATTLMDGKVLIVGGADNAGKTLNTTIVYNPANGSFTAGPNLDVARERHTATLIAVGPNAGKVLIAGGRAKQGNNYTVHDTYVLCNATACDAPVAGVIAKRHSHVAVEMTSPNGDRDILLAGGSNGATDLNTSDLYSYDVLPNTWTWSKPTAFTVGRREIAGAELPFAQALIAGGSVGTTPQSVADVFSPPYASVQPMGTPWSAAGPVPRTGHTATSLRDGSGKVIGVLVTGGVSTAGKSINSAETYGMP